MITTILAFCIGIGIPILLFIYSIKKKLYVPFLLGVIAFVSSQMLLRIPILQYLQANHPSYLFFSATKPILFAMIIGLSAGVFEEGARFLLMKYFLKKRNWHSGFIFGAGHGGVEVVIFYGMPVFITIFSGANGITDTGIMIGGFERIVAMMLHISFSIMVLLSVVKKRWIYFIAAIIIHGFVDTLIGILPLFVQGNMLIVLLETIFAVTAILVMIYSIRKRGELR